MQPHMVDGLSSSRNPERAHSAERLRRSSTSYTNPGLLHRVAHSRSLLTFGRGIR